MEGCRASRREENHQSGSERGGTSGNSRSRKRTGERKGSSTEIRESSEVEVPPGDKPGKTFCVLYCNAYSLLNKLDELTSFAFDCKPDFIAVCETWGNDSLTDSFFSIPGYELCTRRDRNDTTEGIDGGLIIYAKKYLADNVTEVISDKLDRFEQVSAIRIGLDGQPEITLVLLYRPHHIYDNKVVDVSRTNENNSLLCEILHHIPKPYVIVGDLNYSNIDWETLSSSGGSENFMTAANDNFLSQHINFFTHKSGTQPDVVLSSISDIVLDVEEMCHLGSSDHSMVMVKVCLNGSRTPVREYRTLGDIR